MNESHPLLQGSENIVADGGLFGARVSNKNDKLDSSEEIMRRIAEMKEKAAELRRNYEKGLESDKDRASYKAGHREVWVRRDNLLEVLMSSLRGKLEIVGRQALSRLQSLDILTLSHADLLHRYL